MGMQQQYANYFNFSGGINTDASPLNIKPIENLDIDNIWIEKDGSIRRMRGMDTLSPNYVLHDKNENSTIETFYWETHNQLGQFKSYVAIITRQYIHLYDIYVEALNSNPLLTYDFEPELGKDFSYAVDGYRIIIAHSNGYPFYLYLDAGNNLKKEEIPIFLRDLNFDPKEHNIDIDNEDEHYFDDLFLKSFAEGGYPSAVALFGGRIFLGSFLEDAPTVYFSQILEGLPTMKKDLKEKYTEFGYGDIIPQTQDYTKFFTENPSWSLIDPAIVADDGGYVKLTGAEEIKALAGYKDSIFAFCKNGIWRIFGRDGVFKADDFGVERLSNAGLISKKAFVFMENFPVYASDNGIYVIAPDQLSGELTSTSLTENFIDNIYNSIPINCKELSRLYYDRDEKRLFFCYNANLGRVNSTLKFGRYSDFLIYNGKFKCWHKRTFNDEQEDSLRPSCLFFLPFQTITGNTLAIDIVTDDAGNTLITNNNDTIGVLSDIQYKETYRTFVTLESVDNKYTFGFFEGDYFYDFYNLGETMREKYISRIISSHQLYEDIARKKQLPYIHILFKRTESGIKTPVGIDTNPSDAVLRVALSFTSQPYIVYDQFNQPYIKNAQFGKERYIYSIKRNERDRFKDYLIFTNRILGRGKSLQFIISNRRDEYSFICLNDNVSTSPLLDKTNWQEIDYDKSYEHFQPETIYNKNDIVKIEIEYDFHIIGWACNLIAKYNSSGGD